MDMYEIYLDGTMLPVAPAVITTKTGGRNQTVSLINGDEINLIKKPALTNVSFSFLLPSQKYPFAVYERGFKLPEYYLSKLKNLKSSLKPFKLIIIRNNFHSTSMKVTLEDYTVIEDDERDGTDITVSINLKEYRGYSSKTVDVKSQSVSSPVRENSKENPAVHVVKKGDCLWAIAQKYLGDGNRFKEIYNANKGLIDKGNTGTGYPIYTIYPGQKLTITE